MMRKFPCLDFFVYVILLRFATSALAANIPVAPNMTVPVSNSIYCSTTRPFSPFYITLKSCARMLPPPFPDGRDSDFEFERN